MQSLDDDENNFSHRKISSLALNSSRESDYNSKVITIPQQGCQRSNTPGCNGVYISNKVK